MIPYANLDLFIKIIETLSIIVNILFETKELEIYNSFGEFFNTCG